MTRTRLSAVAVSTGLIGAVVGALAAFDDGIGLIAVMALIGAAFGLPIGVGIWMLAKVIFRGSRDRGATLDGDEEQEGHRQLDELRDDRPFRHDDYYPRNPDPAWKTPDSRDWKR